MNSCGQAIHLSVRNDRILYSFHFLSLRRKVLRSYNMPNFLFSDELNGRVRIENGLLRSFIAIRIRELNK